METPKITVNEALIIAKEYHLEAEVTECIKHSRGQHQLSSLYV